MKCSTTWHLESIVSAKIRKIWGRHFEPETHEKILSGRRTQNSFFTFLGIMVGVTEKVASNDFVSVGVFIFMKLSHIYMTF